jgi:hypothetical protein
MGIQAIQNDPNIANKNLLVGVRSKLSIFVM